MLGNNIIQGDQAVDGCGIAVTSTTGGGIYVRHSADPFVCNNRVPPAGGFAPRLEWRQRLAAGSFLAFLPCFPPGLAAGLVCFCLPAAGLSWSRTA